ncbi:MAG: DUF898 domain-containing protein [Gammaproteobacteria bacterium]|nr:DUF898 domain-containing protein [Gammaproteobacteria bacterium]
MSAVQSDLKKYPFEFNGDGWEFFKIWIVNICLSIVTLGIYSAWAKVRTNRYFHNNTSVAGSSFEYLANPIAILKGRLIVFAAFVLYSIVTKVSPVLAGVLFLIYAILVPWAITKSLSFRAYNTAYRNVRFHFKQNFSSAYLIYLGLPAIFFVVVFALTGLMSIVNLLAIPVVIIFIIGFPLAIPAFQWFIKRFFVENSSYGRTAFRFKMSLDSFIGIFLKAILFTILIAIGVVIVMVVLTKVLGVDLQDMQNIEEGGASVPFNIVSALLGMAIYLFPYAYVQTKTANLLFGTTTLGEFSDFRFHCYQDVFEVMVLYITNTLAIVFTLGLFIPWAKVRMAKYKASRLCFMAEQSIDNFAAREQERVSALGEEFGDFADFDIGL